MEPIEEGSSVHYGMAALKSVSSERCASHSDKHLGGELRGGKDGVAAYRCVDWGGDAVFGLKC